MNATANATTPRALRTDAEYDAAVDELNRLLDKHRNPKPGSAADVRIELLTLLVGAYDDQHYPMPTESDPPATVQFVLEQHGKTRADLIPLLGSKSRVSEFLNGKRRLSMSQVGALRREFGIPADLLIEIDKPGPMMKRWNVRPGKASRVSEDSPPYTLGKSHHRTDNAPELSELLANVEAALEANTKVMKALLDELRRRREGRVK